MWFASIVGALEGPVTLVLAAALKGALLIALAFVATHMLRHRGAAVRHAIWAAAIVGHIVLLATLPFAPRVSVPLLPAVTVEGAPALLPIAARSEPTLPATFSVQAETDPVPLASTSRAAEQAVTGINATTVAAGTARTFPSPLAMLIVIWAAGALFVLARYAIGTARVAHIARTSERVADGAWLSLVHRVAMSMGIARPLTLVRGDQLDVPVTWGILYPVVFLPADSDSWDEERQRFVLVHELAHVKRLDALTQLVTQIAVAVFWFNPLVWYAASRVRSERERACDDQVLLHGVRPSLYADELLDMVRSISPRSGVAPAFAALAMASRSDFEGRMLAILDPQARRSSLSRTGRLAMVAAALLLVAPLAAFQPVARQAPSAESTAPTAVDSNIDGDITVPADANPEGAPGEGAAIDAATADTPAFDDTPNAAGVANGSDLATTPVQVSQSGTAIEERVSGSDSPYYSCRNVNLGERREQTSVHAHTARGGAGYTEVMLRKRGYCMTALLTNGVSLTFNLTDVTGIGPGGRAVFHEVTSEGSRELVITRATNGALDRRYLENGVATDPARGSRWLAEMVRSVVLRGGFGVEERVPQLRARGGISAVLAEASESPSTGVKRAYLVALLRSEPRLTTQETDRVLRQAADEITSSGDLRAVGEAALPHGSPSGASIALLASRMESSGDRRAILTAGLRSGMFSASQSLNQQSEANIVALLRATAGIASSGDKSAVLIEAVPYALRTQAARNSFFDALALVSSSGDQRRVLTQSLQHLPRDIGSVRLFASAVDSIASSGDKAAVLIAGINAGLASDDQTREALLSAASNIRSDSDKSRVLTALLRR